MKILFAVLQLYSHNVFLYHFVFLINKIFKETSVLIQNTVYADIKLNQQEKPGFILFAFILNLI
jgi:hypothetical protein